MNWQQYFNAYPHMPNAPPPSAANGYGWAGHGYGWQLDPSSWQTPSLYPSLADVIEEPACAVQKVETVEVSSAMFLMLLYP